MSRVKSGKGVGSLYIGTDGTHLTAYSHTAAGQLAVAGLKVPNLNLDYYLQETPNDENDYDFLDRFGRIRFQMWLDADVPEVRDMYIYSHDYAGNRLLSPRLSETASLGLCEM